MKTAAAGAASTVNSAARASRCTSPGNARTVVSSSKQSDGRTSVAIAPPRAGSALRKSAAAHPCTLPDAQSDTTHADTAATATQSDATARAKASATKRTAVHSQGPTQRLAAPSVIASGQSKPAAYAVVTTASCAEATKPTPCPAPIAERPHRKTDPDTNTADDCANSGQPRQSEPSGQPSGEPAKAR